MKISIVSSKIQKILKDKTFSDKKVVIKTKFVDFNKSNIKSYLADCCLEYADDEEVGKTLAGAIRAAKVNSLNYSKEKVKRTVISVGPVSKYLSIYSCPDKYKMFTITFDSVEHRQMFMDNIVKYSA